MLQFVCKEQNFPVLLKLSPVLTVYSLHRCTFPTVKLDQLAWFSVEYGPFAGASVAGALLCIGVPV